MQYMNRIKAMSLSSLAEEYYPDGRSKSWKREMFRRELELKFGHHLPLKKRIERKGWYKCKRLPPAMVQIIVERLGEP